VGAWPRLIEPFDEEAASSWVNRVCRIFHAPWDTIVSTWHRGEVGDVALDAGQLGLDVRRMADVSGINTQMLRTMFLTHQFPATWRAIRRPGESVDELLGWESWRPFGTTQLIKLCPRCLAESGTFYYQLSWRFKVIRTCQSHKCWLLPAHQAGDQARFRGDGTGRLADALALDQLSLRAMRKGQLTLSSLVVPAGVWFSTLLPALILQIEGKHWPKKHPGIARLEAESERLGQLFKD